MKDKKILKFTIISAILVIVLGTLLHFTYDWSNQNKIVGYFSATNESTWEHLKLLYFPMLITTIIGSFYLKENTSNYWCARNTGIITAIIFTIVFFYTYTGILGYNIGILNIATFVIAVIIGEFVSYKIMNSFIICKKKEAILSLIILFILFIIFTNNPPTIGLFTPPII